jgi:nicotinamide riboside kinase
MIFAIVGAESTGKTVLAQALAQRLRAAWVPEVLREWCEREGRTPRADEQRAIAAEQRRRIETAADVHEIVIADTAPLMIAVYSDLLFGDRSLYEEAIDWHARRVAATLLTGLDLPWLADGFMRDGPHVRAPVDRRVRDALAARGIPFGVVYGRDDLRTEAALAALRPLLPGTEEREGRPLRPRRCLECLDADCEQALHRRA